MNSLNATPFVSSYSHFNDYTESTLLEYCNNKIASKIIINSINTINTHTDINKIIAQLLILYYIHIDLKEHTFHILVDISLNILRTKNHSFCT